MRHETKTVDRRADYYAKVAHHIALDTLSFYCRAERGRRFQATFSTEYERQQMLDAQPTEYDYEH